MKPTNLLVGAAVVSTFCAARAQTPATAPAAVPAFVQEIRVAPGTLSGRILGSVSRQPVAAHEVQVLDASGKRIGSFTTDASGVYETPVLQRGSYTLQVEDRLTLQLAVAEDGKIENLDIVLPQDPKKPLRPIRPQPPNAQGPVTPQNPATIPAAPGGAAPVAGAGTAAPVAGATTAAASPTVGLGVGTWALIGGGAAAAVAVPVIASNSGGSSENPVSVSGLGVRR